MDTRPGEVVVELLFPRFKRLIFGRVKMLKNKPEWAKIRLSDDLDADQKAVERDMRDPHVS